MGEQQDGQRGRQQAEPVQVTVSRSGGFAGVTRQWTADTESTPGEVADRLDELVEQAPLDTLTSPRSGPGAGGARPGLPDSFAYELDVRRGGRHWHGTVNESDAPKELIDLVDHVRLHGRSV